MEPMTLPEMLAAGILRQDPPGSQRLVLNTTNDKDRPDKGAVPIAEPLARRLIVGKTHI